MSRFDYYETAADPDFVWEVADHEIGVNIAQSRHDPDMFNIYFEDGDLEVQVNLDELKSLSVLTGAIVEAFFFDEEDEEDEEEDDGQLDLFEDQPDIEDDMEFQAQEDSGWKEEEGDELDYLVSAILYGFDWREADEGYDVWSDAFDALLGLDAFPTELDDYDFKKAAGILITRLIWSEQPEGHEFWSKVYDGLMARARGFEGSEAA